MALRGFARGPNLEKCFHSETSVAPGACAPSQLIGIALLRVPKDL